MANLPKIPNNNLPSTTTKLIGKSLLRSAKDPRFVVFSTIVGGLWNYFSPDDSDSPDQEQIHDDLLQLQQMNGFRLSTLERGRRDYDEFDMRDSPTAPDADGRMPSRSLVEMAAYISGTRMRDEAQGITYDFSDRGNVIYGDTLVPHWISEEMRADVEGMWNGYSDTERAQAGTPLANHLVLALPALDFAQNRLLVEEYLQPFVDDGMIVHYALHDKRAETGEFTPYAYILAPMRRMNGDLEWSEQQTPEWLSYQDAPDGQIVHNEEWQQRWFDTVDSFYETYATDAQKEARTAFLDDLPDRETPEGIVAWQELMTHPTVVTLDPPTARNLDHIDEFQQGGARQESENWAFEQREQSPSLSRTAYSMQFLQLGGTRGTLGQIARGQDSDTQQVDSLMEVVSYQNGIALSTYGDNRTDYSDRGDVLVQNVVAPDSAPSWVIEDQSRLWGSLSGSTDDKQAILASTMTIGLPPLPPDELQDMLETHLRDELASQGLIADYAIHLAYINGAYAPHAHVHVPVLELDTSINPEGEWGKVHSAFSHPEQTATQLRHSWQALQKDWGIDTAIEEQAREESRLIEEEQQLREEDEIEEARLLEEEQQRIEEEQRLSAWQANEPTNMPIQGAQPYPTPPPRPLPYANVEERPDYGEAVSIYNSFFAKQFASFAEFMAYILGLNQGIIPSAYADEPISEAQQPEIAIYDSIIASEEAEDDSLPLSAQERVYLDRQILRTHPYGVTTLVRGEEEFEGFYTQDEVFEPNIRVNNLVEFAAFTNGQALHDYDAPSSPPFDYSTRGDLRHRAMLTPEGVILNSEQLWNVVNGSESQAEDTPLAQRIEIFLPIELDFEQNRQLLEAHLHELFVEEGLIADYAIFDKRGGAGGWNPSAVVLVPIREPETYLEAIAEKEELSPLDRDDLPVSYGEWKERVEAFFEERATPEQQEERRIFIETNERGGYGHLEPPDENWGQMQVSIPLEQWKADAHHIRPEHRPLVPLLDDTSDIPSYRVSLLTSEVNPESALVDAQSERPTSIHSLPKHVAFQLGTYMDASDEVDRNSYIGWQDHYDYTERGDVLTKGSIVREHISSLAENDNLPSAKGFWQSVEQMEEGENALLSQQVTIDLPNDMPPVALRELVEKHISDSFVSDGMAAHYAIQDGIGSDGNWQPRANVFLPLREMDADGSFAPEQNPEWLDPALSAQWEQEWQAQVETFRIQQQDRQQEVQALPDHAMDTSPAPSQEQGRAPLELMDIPQYDPAPMTSLPDSLPIPDLAGERAAQASIVSDYVASYTPPSVAEISYAVEAAEPQISYDYTPSYDYSPAPAMEMDLED